MRFSNKITAILYLIYIIALLIFHMIYMWFITERRVKFITVAFSFFEFLTIIYLCVKIYFMKDDDYSDFSDYSSDDDDDDLSLRCKVAVISYTWVICRFLKDYFKSDRKIKYEYEDNYPESNLSSSEIIKIAKHYNLIDNLTFLLVITISFIAYYIFYYPYVNGKENESDSHYSRKLEAGERDRESIH